jgi:parafibromin
VPSKADAAFVKRLRTSGTEIILRTRNDALHGSHPWVKHIDFTSLRLSLAPTIEAARKAAGAGSSKSSSQPLPSSTSSRALAKKGRAQDPIIMLSNSPTSLITMFNVKSLLEGGVFIDPTEARMAANGQSEGIVSILHRSSASDANAKPTRFLVVDNAETLSRLGGGGNQDVWGRVVAVFTTGQTWQFKAYRYTEAKELFRHGEYRALSTPVIHYLLTREPPCSFLYLLFAQFWVSMLDGTMRQGAPSLATGR